MWFGHECLVTLALVFVFWCAGGPEELRFSARMAVQEWRTAAVAENGLRDCCWGHPHAQTQLPAQVNHANVNLHLRDAHTLISISFLIGLAVCKHHKSMFKATRGIDPNLSVAAARVCFCPPFPPLHQLASFFSKKGHGAVKGNVALSFFPFQASRGRQSYLGCLAMLSASVPSRMLRICWKVSDCTAPLDYGVLAVHRHWDMMILRFERKRIPPNGAQRVGGVIWPATPKEAWRFHAVVVAIVKILALLDFCFQIWFTAKRWLVLPLWASRWARLVEWNCMNQKEQQTACANATFLDCSCA